MVQLHDLCDTGGANLSARVQGVKQRILYVSCYISELRIICSVEQFEDANPTIGLMVLISRAKRGRNMERLNRTIRKILLMMQKKSGGSTLVMALQNKSIRVTKLR